MEKLVKKNIIRKNRERDLLLFGGLLWHSAIPEGIFGFALEKTVKTELEFPRKGNFADSEREPEFPRRGNFDDLTNLLFQPGGEQFAFDWVTDLRDSDSFLNFAIEKFGFPVSGIAHTLPDPATHSKWLWDWMCNSEKMEAEIGQLTRLNWKIIRVICEIAMSFGTCESGTPESGTRELEDPFAENGEILEDWSCISEKVGVGENLNHVGKIRAFVRSGNLLAVSEEKEISLVPKLVASLALQFEEAERLINWCVSGDEQSEELSLRSKRENERTKQGYVLTIPTRILTSSKRANTKLREKLFRLGRVEEICLFSVETTEDEFCVVAIRPVIQISSVANLREKQFNSSISVSRIVNFVQIKIGQIDQAKLPRDFLITIPSASSVSKLPKKLMMGCSLILLGDLLRKKGAAGKSLVPSSSLILSEEKIAFITPNSSEVSWTTEQGIRFVKNSLLQSIKSTRINFVWEIGDCVSFAVDKFWILESGWVEEMWFISELLVRRAARTVERDGTLAEFMSIRVILPEVKICSDILERIRKLREMEREMKKEIRAFEQIYGGGGVEGVGIGQIEDKINKILDEFLV